MTKQWNYNKAIEINPDYVESYKTYNNIGHFYFEQNVGVKFPCVTRLAAMRGR